MSDIFSVRRNDLHVLNDSQLNLRMAEAQTESPDQYILYGDSAFTTPNSHITCKFTDNMTIRKRVFNRSINKCRESVEHAFKEVKCKFKFINYYQDLKLLKTHVQNIIFTVVLLTNCYNCLCPNQISTYFDMPPPSIEEYMSNLD